MGQDTNVGQQTSLAVYGNPESFKKLINNHGLTCKIKQAISCPCVGRNNGSPDMNCDICNGDGYVYTYQRRFLISDENSNVCGKVVTPFFRPILSVEKVQSMNSAIQGGIKDFSVESFDDTTITLTEAPCPHTKKRVTYNFDGWTYVAREKLRVDVINKIMYADGTIFDAKYQSSNPLKAYADIAHVVRIWNDTTGKELKTYSIEGNTLSTTQSITDNMYIEYYIADLTKVLASDVNNTSASEIYSHDLESGECKMAFFPYWELSIGDIIVLSAVVLYKSEQIVHQKDLDRLHEIECFDLNEVIIDEDNNRYMIDQHYILQGRHIKWITSTKPDIGKIFSVRYGYKPAYIIFENNAMPNNLENKIYPITVHAKSWTKTSKDDLARLNGGK